MIEATGCVAQWIEHWTGKPEVVSSILTSGTYEKESFFIGLGYFLYVTNLWASNPRSLIKIRVEYLT